MNQQIEQMNTKINAIEANINELIARPVIQPEINIEGILNILGQLMSKTEQIYIAVAPQTQPDLTAQAQQALAQLQAIQAQLQAQAQTINIPEGGVQYVPQGNIIPEE